jgi:hypothetical protein
LRVVGGGAPTVIEIAQPLIISSRAELAALDLP